MNIPKPALGLVLYLCGFRAIEIDAVSSSYLIQW